MLSQVNLLLHYVQIRRNVVAAIVSWLD